MLSTDRSQRTEEALLKEIRRKFFLNGMESTEKIKATLAEFTDNSIFQKGNGLLGQAQSKGVGAGKGEVVGGKADDGGKGALCGGKGEKKGTDKPVFMPEPSQAQADEVEAPPNRWYIGTSQMVAKCANKVQSELMHDNIVKYFSEWCETEDCRQVGCCYSDCAFLYDNQGKPIYMLDKRSAFHNINTSINKAFLDPVIESIVPKVEKMYQRTFWAALPASLLCHACTALAKRGKNINQITFFLGPGGVGLSLFTAHLAAIYGATNHRYFDPNIFYNDELMMKFIPLLTGGFLFSGQERPGGANNFLRDGLLKKFATAEGIAGRLPYSVLTKLICLVG